MNYYIRLVWFQCKVTILFTVFKLAPAPLPAHRGQLQQQSTACTYSHSCRLTLKNVYEVKQANKMNINRTCNTGQQEAQQNILWRCISLVHVIKGYGRFPSFVIVSLARVWRQSWSPVKSFCRFCMSALGLVLFKHRPNKNYTLFFAYCNTWKSDRLLFF